MSKKSIIMSAVSVFLVVALAVGGYFIYDALKPQASDGEKSVTLTVTDAVSGAESKEYKLKTNALYLDELLLESGIVEGKEGTYGFEITSANGIAADGAKFQYWAIYVNGEYGQYGASSQPVNDGDSFEIKLESWQ